MTSEESVTTTSFLQSTYDALRALPSRPAFWIALVCVVLISIFYYAFVGNHSSLADLFFFEIKHDIIGGLLFVPIVFAAVTMRLPGLLAAWGLSFGILLPRLVRHSLGLDSLAANVLFFVVPLLVGIAVILDVEWRSRHRLLTREREIERQMHVDHVYRVQEDERRRIAQGLHDDVLQRLLSIAYVAEKLDEQVAIAHPSVASQAAAIREDSLRLAEDLRRLSYDLRPTILDDLGLFSAIEWLLSRLRVETGTGTTLEVGHRSRRFDHSLETAAYRVAQEALSNVRRHSNASNVCVKLDVVDDALVMDISDDGVGFPARRAMQQAVTEGHLGLLGMHWRVKSLKGTLTIRSSQGHGTHIHVSIPLSATQEERTRAD